MYLRTAIEDDFEDRTQGSLNNCLYLLARARPTGDDDAFQRHPECRLTLVKQLAGTKTIFAWCRCRQSSRPPAARLPSTGEVKPEWRRIGDQGVSLRTECPWNVEMLGI